MIRVLAFLVGFFLTIAVAACMLTDDGRRAISIEDARGALEGALLNMEAADLNGDGKLQVDSNSGISIESIGKHAKGAAEGILARDANGDGMIDDQEMLQAAPAMAARLLIFARSQGLEPADGEVDELVMAGLLMADRIIAAMSR